MYENSQIIFELEWLDRQNGNKPENSIVSFEEFKNNDPEFLIEFLTMHIVYIKTDGE